MTESTLVLESKLPTLGTTIFTTMSALAQKVGAINLSQGFPDFSGPEYLQQRLAYHVQQGANQYAPMSGIPALREAISKKINRCYNSHVDPETEITVTAGATEALFSVITALVRAGDEVICFEPSYDSYAPAVELAGGTMKHVRLTPPDFSPNWSEFSALITDKTRLVILNTPHNPTASVWQKKDFEALWQAIADKPILVLSDEVYEHICFEQAGHYSLLQHPELRARGIAVSSFGKTYHMTGWKVGYCVAPPALTTEIRKIHQYLTFSVHTPSQLAIADMLNQVPEHDQELPSFYQQRRDFFINALQSSRFTLLPCQGTYFLLLDYSAISTMNDVDFCIYLTEKIGVAAIPLSVFCKETFPHHLIRVCFAKEEATLRAAAEKLCQL
ncbi:pyridoxal phosphate-dependent aminotransferase [Rosenbergiella australiborealis]|uniref:Pyridoxal phosphate-dependent aminotransferase n=1 Tax=Rosenbergiella australiborealis TaxID=1544696 RepID=A0ABS5TA46_9GAMM|nr:pyridoxal phosphate-dependent aminotransferase [Rosenbergiella australiborealis]MBT0728385.1 pyridoxal phosphate-dependent aminotransferase [Rosenbergiella australiborealis]